MGEYNPNWLQDDFKKKYWKCSSCKTSVRKTDDKCWNCNTRRFPKSS